MTGSGPTQLTIVRLHIHSLSPDSLYDLQTLARLAGVHPTLVSQYIQRGLLDPVEDRGGQDWWFNDRSLYILRKIQRLRTDLGVNLNGVAVVLELLRQIDELQRESARPRDD
jgi:MerR family transcriptional regulator/heat shock protein HspR